ncbi:MAG: hypothetical protein J6568_04075 [Snodgrassella sp.]|nr:hypothetical protein [Snodgrassella sp.]
MAILDWSFPLLLQAMPLVLVAVIVIVIVSAMLGQQTAYVLHSGAFVRQVISALLAYVLSGITALPIMLMLVRHYGLRRHKTRAWQCFIPLLLSITKHMFQSLLAEFVLLNITVTSKMAFPQRYLGN